MNWWCRGALRHGFSHERAAVAGKPLSELVDHLHASRIWLAPEAADHDLPGRASGLWVLLDKLAVCGKAHVVVNLLLQTEQLLVRTGPRLVPNDEQLHNTLGVLTDKIDLPWVEGS